MEKNWSEVIAKNNLTSKCFGENINEYFRGVQYTVCAMGEAGIDVDELSRDDEFDMARGLYDRYIESMQGMRVEKSYDGLLDFVRRVSDEGQL